MTPARDDKYILELYHKRLKNSGWKPTSPKSRLYNCIAWALGHQDRRWDPFPEGTDYWPPGLDKTNTTQTWIALFKKYRYRRCANGNLQEGYEKVAIYVDQDDTPTHVARQIGDDLWTSKMGHLHDIEHSLGLLNGYGAASIFLKRKHRAR